MKNLFNADIVLNCYVNGYFPMADLEDNEIYWHFPNPRAVFNIYNTILPRSVRKLYNSKRYYFKVDTVFSEVINHCANRSETWINSDIIEVYSTLHQRGFAHSVEVFNHNNQLVGGLYGVAIGGAFFGESMFNTEPNTAKLAFVKLLEVLKANKFLLLDSQYINDFTAQLGAVEISAEDYLKLLKLAIYIDADFKDNNYE